MAAFDYPRIAEDWFTTDEAVAYEMTIKGWVCIHVEVGQGQYYQICFYDLARVEQELDGAVRRGSPYFASFYGLVILPSVTVEAIEKAVQMLWQRNYFKYLKPDVEFEPS